MMEQENKTMTKFKDIAVVKVVYNFVKANYESFDVISIELDDSILNIYVEGKVYNYYRDVIDLQKQIKKYLSDNYEQDMLRVNILKY